LRLAKINIGYCASDFVEAISKSPSLHTLGMSVNDIQIKAPEESWAEMTIFNIIANSGYLSLYEMQQIAGDEILAPINRRRSSYV
jgi:hypothetical protein